MLLEGNLRLHRGWAVAALQRAGMVLGVHQTPTAERDSNWGQSDLVSCSHLCTISLALLKMRAIQFIFSSFSSCPSSQNCHEGILLSCLLESLSPLVFFLAFCVFSASCICFPLNCFLIFSKLASCYWGVRAGRMLFSLTQSSCCPSTILHGFLTRLLTFWSLFT